MRRCTCVFRWIKASPVGGSIYVTCRFYCRASFQFRFAGNLKGLPEVTGDRSEGPPVGGEVGGCSGGLQGRRPSSAPADSPGQQRSHSSILRRSLPVPFLPSTSLFPSSWGSPGGDRWLFGWGPRECQAGGVLEAQCGIPARRLEIGEGAASQARPRGQGTRPSWKEGVEL